MTDIIKKIEQLESVPEEKQLLFVEAGDLKKYAEENSIIEAIALAFKYGFSAGRNFEKED